MNNGQSNNNFKWNPSFIQPSTQSQQQQQQQQQNNNNQNGFMQYFPLHIPSPAPAPTPQQTNNNGSNTNMFNPGNNAPFNVPYNAHINAQQSNAKPATNNNGNGTMTNIPMITNSNPSNDGTCAQPAMQQLNLLMKELSLKEREKQFLEKQYDGMKEEYARFREDANNRIASANNTMDEMKQQLTQSQTAQQTMAQKLENYANANRDLHQKLVDINGKNAALQQQLSLKEREIKHLKMSLLKKDSKTESKTEEKMNENDSNEDDDMESLSSESMGVGDSLYVQPKSKKRKKSQKYSKKQPKITGRKRGREKEQEKDKKKKKKKKKQKKEKVKVAVHDTLIDAKLKKNTYGPWEYGGKDIKKDIKNKQNFLNFTRDSKAFLVRKCMIGNIGIPKVEMKCNPRDGLLTKKDALVAWYSMNWTGLSEANAMIEEEVDAKSKLKPAEVERAKKHLFDYKEGFEPYKNYMEAMMNNKSDKDKDKENEMDIEDDNDANDTVDNRKAIVADKKADEEAKLLVKKHVCIKGPAECTFCSTRTNNDIVHSLNPEVAIEPERLYHLQPSLRLYMFCYTNVVIRRDAVLCGKCQMIPPQKLKKMLLRQKHSLRSLSDDDPLPRAWLQRHRQAVKRLLINAATIDKMKTELKFWKQNQRGPHDVRHRYARLQVDWNDAVKLQAYKQTVADSETKYCVGTALADDDDDDAKLEVLSAFAEDLIAGNVHRPKLHTNRRINFVSYYKLSEQDCFDLCGNTRRQIQKMSNECEISEEIMFFFWQRFWNKESFRKQSVLFGVSETALKKWWHLTKEKLESWAEKTVINGGPENEQVWTTQRIRERTTEACRRCFEEHGIPRTIVIMDGTYIYTQEIQTDHAVRKLMWSGQKDCVLLKPHLTVTSMGDIIHGGDLYFSNGHHGDSHIYKCMTDLQYLNECHSTTDAAKNVLTKKQVKACVYFNKIWAEQNGIVLTDNGYTAKDPKIRRPRKEKQSRSSTVNAAVKRAVTLHRQVTERVNKSIKRWGILSKGKVLAAELPNLRAYLMIAIGHHNTFSCTFQKDTEVSALQVDRLLEIRQVVQNPCDHYWKEKPPPRRRTKQQIKNNVKLPPLPPFDDGFETRATGMNEAVQWIEQQQWLQNLQLTENDHRDFIGLQFQHKLSNRYLRKLEKNFRVKQHKTNSFVLKFENLKSKFISAKFRHVILNFAEIIQHRMLINPNVPPLQSLTSEDEDEDMFVLGNEDSTKLKPKAWKDIDFSLWSTDLARLQYYCTCNSGAQLVNPCAHVATCISMIIWIFLGKMNEKLAMSKRDLAIKRGIINLSPAVQSFNEQKKKNEKVQVHCVCQQPFHGFMAQCKCCEEFYHPPCIFRTKEEIEQQGLENFMCSRCDPYTLFIKQYAPREPGQEDDGLCPMLEENV